MTDVGKLKQSLTTTQDETVIRDMWRQIDHRRNRKRQTTFRQPEWGWGTAMVGAVAMLAVVLIFSFHQPTGELRLDENQALASVIYASTEQQFRFSDKSQLTVLSNSRLDTLVNTDSIIEFALRKGGARFEVTPGGTRIWKVNCGSISVTVVGTVFEVTRSTTGVLVSVSRGKVLVKGSNVPDGVQQLTPQMELFVPFMDGTNSSADDDNTSAGTNIRTEQSSSEGLRNTSLTTVPRATSNDQQTSGSLATEPRTIAQPQSEENRMLNMEPQAAASMPPASSLPSTNQIDSSWQFLAHQGRFQEAYQALPNDVFAASSLAVLSQSDLFLLADTARAAGHSVEASPVLRYIIEHHPGTSRAGVAAYTLGKIEMDVQHRPLHAKQLFETALKFGLSRPLEETAVARIVEACQETNAADLPYWSRFYVAQYPNGRYLDIVRGVQQTNP